MKDCNQEYSYHLNILECINNNESIEKLEEIVNESLSYFQEQELWKDIQIYTELLAGKWYNVGAKEKACEYYRLGHEARTLLKRKGAFKMKKIKITLMGLIGIAVLSFGLNSPSIEKVQHLH